MGEWSPTAVALIITTIGVVIEKTLTSYFTGKKLAMIEAHVNGQKSSDNAKIESLQRENIMLREHAAEKREIASVLAVKNGGL